MLLLQTLQGGPFLSRPDQTYFFIFYIKCTFFVFPLRHVCTQHVVSPYIGENYPHLGYFAFNNYLKFFPEPESITYSKNALFFII
ncbi:hypothetical protein B5F87_09200 [Eubacterium sp. An3]|nr:hypothetical protein B5F87_09200 [Eubacterium sp. An3]